MAGSISISNTESIAVIERKVVKLLVENLNSTELEIIRDFSTHWDLFNTALDEVTKEECGHCGEPMSEHDDGDCPMPKDVYDKEE